MPPRMSVAGRRAASGDRSQGPARLPVRRHAVAGVAGPISRCRRAVEPLVTSHQPAVDATNIPMVVGAIYRLVARTPAAAIRTAIIPESAAASVHGPADDHRRPDRRVLR